MASERVRLHDEPWSWTLDQVADSFILTVVCGSVGLYERAVVLEAAEIDAWYQSGPDGLQALAAAIQFDAGGTRFAHRFRPDLIASGSD